MHTETVTAASVEALLGGTRLHKICIRICYEGNT